MDNRSIEAVQKEPIQKVRPKGAFSLKDMDWTFSTVDRALLYTVMVLVIFGSVMVISTVSYNAIISGNSLSVIVIKQALFAVIGFIGLFVFSNYDYRRIDFMKLLIVGGLILALNLLLLVYGDTRLGATRWIFIGDISIQPSEFAKYYMAVLSAYMFSFATEYRGGTMRYLKEKDRTGATVTKRFFVTLGVLGIFAFLIIVKQSNLSTGAIMMMGFLLILFLSDMRWYFFGATLLVSIAVGAVTILTSDYRRKRLLSHIFGSSDSGTTQIQQSLYALSMGGFFGRGLGNSRLKANWLPIAENDFIFAIISEEWGFLGAFTLMLLFYFLVYRGFKIAFNAKDRYGQLIAAGIIFIIAVQALINLVVVTGLGPVTGVPLPFISQGGTSLIVNMSMMGIVLNISKSGGTSNGRA